ncbi:MAG: bifunctional phosphopantothenoylcysteine decarboxylase/phosphopantothenate--cysteine ligase CoaBC [Syntrophobacterales bacterium]|nr:bifunctional phosphopantothenoylcysteine decarboxylase/phosphopantothenate--cysteine ligase CoaBC [Syntrophobacterales bacterium]
MPTEKRVVLGVTGGIAAYKAAELTRMLVKNNISVKVIMTDHAREFITPLTFQVLSGNPVFTGMFSQEHYDLNHISLAAFGDAVVVAPATANIIGKMAAGIADDLLSTVLLATKAPVIVCPAMNENMFLHPAVQENLEILKKRGVCLVAPGYGELACKAAGVGRLAELDQIMEALASVWTVKDLRGERILVTAGPTREPFDPVRFITNYSSGKMGYALAVMALRRGAEVTLISGPSALPVPPGIEFVSVGSAREMRDAVMAHLEAATVVIKAAAVADYRPAVRAENKLKKKTGPLLLSLERNPDIIAEVGKKKGNRVLVGFAMESENLLANAREKLFAKHMDLIVANDLHEEGAGFQCDTNIIKILDPRGGVEAVPLMDKQDIAGRILDRVKALVDERRR